MGDWPDRAIPFPGTSIFEHGKWRKGKEAGPEYVRADLYDAAMAERDALRAQVETQRLALEKIAYMRPAGARDTAHQTLPMLRAALR